MSTPSAPATPDAVPGSQNRFAPGTFRPGPRPAPLAAMLAAQSRLELRLILRNGEQLLLTMFIPITLLIGLCMLPIDTVLGSTNTERAATVVPAIMTVAVMSTAFTGQAIAVGFDRRYGALKRLGATPIPRWGVIAGKSIAVAAVVAMQSVILGGIGFALGWRPSPWGLLLGAVIIALGTVTFAILGLLLGGTLKAEVVLALANLLWFALVGISSLVILDDQVPDAAFWFARLTPSGALTESLERATDGHVDVVGIGVLLAWAAIAVGPAVRWFRFQ